MNNSSQNVSATQLADLLQIADYAPDDAEELREIWDYEFNAPVHFEISKMDAKTQRKVEARSQSQGLLVRSFHDLLLHPEPSLELLVMTKEFARKSSRHPGSAIPKQVSKLLYYLTIAAALVHHDRSISQLGANKVAEGINWALKRKWIDVQSKEVLSTAFAKLTEGKGQH